VGASGLLIGNARGFTALPVVMFRFAQNNDSPANYDWTVE